jgi:hypothetical protein
MEYVRSKLLLYNHEGAAGEKSPHQQFEEKTIVIYPGRVEEAIHAVSVPGKISLEELRFWAYVPDPHDYYDSENTIRDNSADAEMSEEHNPTDHTENILNSDAEDQKKQHRRETQDAYLDIVVFEIPVHCSSGTTPCDLPSYGIGAIVDDHPEGSIPQPYLTLCNATTGRLNLHTDTFRGYHTALHIPPTGYLMKDRITDPEAHKIPSFPSKDSQYEILIANCDTHVYGTGRNIELSGEIVFEYDPSLLTASGSEESGSSQHYNGANDSPSHYHIGTRHQQEEYGEIIVIDPMSLLKLVGVGLFICVFFTLASFRIHRGTREDYFMTRMNERRRNANSSSSNGDSGGESGEGGA